MAANKEGHTPSLLPVALLRACRPSTASCSLLHVCQVDEEASVELSSSDLYATSALSKVLSSVLSAALPIIQCSGGYLEQRPTVERHESTTAKVTRIIAICSNALLCTERQHESVPNLVHFCIAAPGARSPR